MTILLSGTGHAVCGDVLFGAGCGQKPRGEPWRNCTTLQRLAQLPDSTAWYSAHEYTAANLSFGAGLRT